MEPKLNWLDKSIAFFSPSAGLERAMKRAALEQVRNYEAASRGRRTAGWKTSSGTQNQIGQYQLKLLRDRSRDLVRNNPLAAQAHRALVTSVVGTGIRPSIAGTQRTVKQVKRFFDEWANDPMLCDWEGRLNFYGMQNLMARCLFESGEFLIVRKRVSQDIPIQLQILEPEYLDMSKDTARTAGQPYIFGGVSFDGRGKRLGYWIYAAHPAEHGMLKSNFVPAEDVIHCFDVLRAGQVRGVPMGTSSFLTLRDLDEYADAQLMKQKVSALLAVLVKDTSEQFAKGDEDILPERLQPGAFMKLGAGQEATVVQPPSTEGYSEYTRDVKHGVAAGFGVPYASMTNDLTQVNYSSGRMGWIDFTRLVEHLQENVIVAQALNRVWGWFMEAGFLSQGFPRTVSCTWTPPRRYLMDPEKEGKAMVEMLRAHMMSWSEAIRQMGYDPDEVRAELEKDKEMWDKLGLNPYSDPRFDATRRQDGEGAPQPATPQANP